MGLIVWVSPIAVPISVGQARTSLPRVLPVDYVAGRGGLAAVVGEYRRCVEDGQLSPMESGRINARSETAERIRLDGGIPADKKVSSHIFPLRQLFPISRTVPVLLCSTRWTSSLVWMAGYALSCSPASNRAARDGCSQKMRPVRSMHECWSSINRHPLTVRRLVEDGVLQTKKVGANSRVWWRPVATEAQQPETTWDRERIRSHPAFDSDLVGDRRLWPLRQTDWTVPRRGRHEAGYQHGEVDTGRPDEVRVEKRKTRTGPLTRWWWWSRVSTDR